MKMIISLIKKCFNKKNNSKVLMILIIFTMYAYPVFFLLGCAVKNYYFLQTSVLPVSLIVIVCMFFYYFFNNQEFKLNKIDILSLLLMIMVLLSTYFSKNKRMTFIGYPFDHEPYTHIITYYLLVMIGMRIVNKEEKNKIIKAALILAAFEVIVGILQHFNLWFIDGKNMKNCKDIGVSYGFTGNQNLFAIITVIFTSYITASFFIVKSRKKRYLLCVGAIISFYCAITTASRIAWAGILGMHAILISIYFLRFIKDKNRSNMINFILKEAIIIGASIIVIIVMYKTNDYTLVSQIQETINDNKIISGKGESMDKFGSSRGVIWRTGLEAIPKNWLFGVGVDNYRYAFTSNPDYKYEFGQYIQNKAHCEYLHVLVNGGVFAFLYHMTLLVTSFIMCIKKVLHEKEDKQRFIFLVVFAAYCVQAFVNVSTIVTAPYFWMVVGLMNDKNDFKTLIVFSKNKIIFKKKNVELD